MTRRAFHNEEPSDLPEGAPRDAVRIEFANRLQRAMVQKGWNQSELARRASEHLPSGQALGRDSISVYMRGKSLPGPAALAALANALGVEKAELIPTRGVARAQDAAPPLDARDLGDGRVWLRVNQAVEWPAALKIMQLLKGEG